ncbi:MAG: N-acyl-D-amino-acid deacylase family protein [Candidatus Bathyarchaeia archaeon]
MVIRNGNIVDGTGSPSSKGSIAVKDEKISLVSEDSIEAETDILIDADGLYLTPGFIDVHNHGDLSILYYPKAEGFVRQGITTFVGGQCGNSPGPFGEWIGLPWLLGDLYQDIDPTMYFKNWLQPRDLLNQRHKEIYGWEIDWNTMGDFFERVERRGHSPNYVPLVGHGDIRSLVMGPDFEREATSEEINEMILHVGQAMDEGCRGLSVGRDYDPGIWAGFDELLACAKVVAGYNGLYASHSLRTGHRKPRRPGQFPPIKTEGVKEAIDIGRKARISVQISHLGILYDIRPDDKPVTEAAVKSTLNLIDEARAEGIDVNFDVIPHHLTGGISTSPWLASGLSPWIRITGNLQQFAESMSIEQFREDIKEKILAGEHYRLNPNINPGWAKSKTIVKCKEDKYVGKTVADIAEEEEINELDALMNVIQKDPDTKAIREGEDDWVKLEFFKHPQMMIGVDTFAVDETRESRYPPTSYPNQNSYGGFPRYLMRSVRETNTLKLEEAIRKVTSLPAKKFNLKDRGIIKENAYADIVILDMNTVSDVGDQLEPRRYPRGIKHVVINGELVVRESIHTGRLPGKLLYRGTDDTL